MFDLVAKMSPGQELALIVKGSLCVAVPGVIAFVFLVGVMEHHNKMARLAKERNERERQELLQTIREAGGSRSTNFDV